MSSLFASYCLSHHYPPVYSAPSLCVLILLFRAHSSILHFIKTHSPTYLWHCSSVTFSLMHFSINSVSSFCSLDTWNFYTDITNLFIFWQFFSLCFIKNMFSNFQWWHTCHFLQQRKEKGIWRGGRGIASQFGLVFCQCEKQTPVSPPTVILISSVKLFRAGDLTSCMISTKTFLTNFFFP